MAGDAGSDSGFFYVLDGAIRILFVDDDPIMREFAAVHLASDKGSVDVAEDGLQALEAVEANDYDIILLDLEMPRMDGFDALARLRASDRSRAIPVVVVTGREDVFAIDRAYQAGATSFLVKPINWRLLSYQVRYVHRSHVMEAAMTRQAENTLKRLAVEAMPLLQEAMRGAPELRRLANDYVDLLESAAGAVRSTEG